MNFIFSFFFILQHTFKIFAMRVRIVLLVNCWLTGLYYIQAMQKPKKSISSWFLLFCHIPKKMEVILKIQDNYYHTLYSIQHAQVRRGHNLQCGLDNWRKYSLMEFINKVVRNLTLIVGRKNNQKRIITHHYIAHTLHQLDILPNHHVSTQVKTYQTWHILCTS